MAMTLDKNNANCNGYTGMTLNKNIANGYDVYVKIRTS